MRRPVIEWISPTDSAILELLGDTKIALTPKIIGHAIDRDNVHVQKRCNILMEAALVTKEAKGLYSITELGMEYLEGEATADDIPTPEKYK